MGAIIFREDVLQSAAISDLNANKVNLSTYNASMNDVSDRFTKLRNDMTAADDAVTSAYQDAIQALKDGDITDINTAITLLNGDADTEGSTDYKISTAITAMVNGAPEAYDTLKELLDLINNEDAGLTELIDQLKAKVNGIVGAASDDWNTLEKIEVATKAIRDDLQSKIDDINSTADDIVASIPHYKYDIGLGITLDDDDNNCITLSLVPTDDIIGGRATVYSEDDDGNITIETINTIHLNAADDKGAKDYIIDTDEDLSSYKCIVEYFFNTSSNS